MGPGRRVDRHLVALGGILVVAVFNAFWRLSTADWKIDESLDGGLAWEAVHHGNWALEDGHPVFHRWFLGFGQELFGQDRLGVRFFPAVASVLAVVLLYFLGKALAGPTVGLVAAGLWAVLPRALVLGHQTVGVVRGDRYAYLEVFMIPALLGAALTGWRWVRRGRWADAVATGLLVGLGASFKPTAFVVLLPIVGTRAVAMWRRPRRGAEGRGPVVAVVGPPAAAMSALAVAVLVVTYAPVGHQALHQLRDVFQYQYDHARTGQTLVFDGKVTRFQPRWSHLLYQWRGMGPAACVGLLIGVAGAWAGRRRRAARYVTAIWLTLLGFHLLSPIALPHYYLLWAPFSVLLAAMGLVDLYERSPRAAAAAGSDGVPRRPSALAGGLVAVAAVLLIGSGAVATANIARIQPGAYGRLSAWLRAEHLHPEVVRYQGEAVNRYFPHARDVGQLGFTSLDVALDLLVLDPRDVPMLPAGLADAARARARQRGLVEEHVGRLEVWIQPPAA